MNSIFTQIGIFSKKSEFKTVIGNFNQITVVSSKVNNSLNLIQQNFQKISNGLNLTNAMIGFQAISSGLARLKTASLGVYKFAESYAGKGDKIAKTSRLVGLSVKEFQAFDSAAKHAGISTEEISGALQKFNVNLGKARSGDKSALKPFEALLPKSLSSYKNNSEVIRALADSYQKLDSAEQKAFVSQNLFGRSGLKMSELLSGGSAELSKYLDSYNEGFSEEGAKNAEAFNDSLQDLQETFDSLKVVLASELFPTFVDLFESVRRFLAENGQNLRKIIKELGVNIANFVKDSLPRILKGLNFVAKIIDIIGPGVVGISIGIAAIMPALASILTGVMAVWPALVAIKGVIAGSILPVLSGVLSSIVSIAAALAPILIPVMVIAWSLKNHWIPTIKLIYDNWDMLVSFICDDVPRMIGDAVESVVGWIVDKFNWAVDGVKSCFEFVVNFLSDVFQSINGFISEYFVNPIKSAIDWINDGIKGILDSLSNIPLIGKLFGGGSSVIEVVDSTRGGAAPNNIAETVGNTTVTRTDRFSVDFQNMPRGVTVTPPSSGNFDYSKGYTLAPGF